MYIIYIISPIDCGRSHAVQPFPPSDDLSFLLGLFHASLRTEDSPKVMPADSADTMHDGQMISKPRVDISLMDIWLVVL